MPPLTIIPFCVPLFVLENICRRVRSKAGSASSTDNDIIKMETRRLWNLYVEYNNGAKHVQPHWDRLNHEFRERLHEVVPRLRAMNFREAIIEDFLDCVKRLLGTCRNSNTQIAVPPGAHNNVPPQGFFDLLDFVTGANRPKHAKIVFTKRDIIDGYLLPPHRNELLEHSSSHPVSVSIRQHLHGIKYEYLYRS